MTPAHFALFTFVNYGLQYALIIKSYMDINNNAREILRQSQTCQTNQKEKPAQPGELF
jgi:hypothetical protein